MIEPLDNMPPGTIGFRAVGIIEPSDYTEHLYPAVDEAIAQHKKVNIVFMVGDDFDRYSMGALWKDTKLIGKPLSVWGRTAFVTNHDWLSHTASIFSFLVPGELKVFPLDEVEEAKRWAGSTVTAIAGE
jgi:hypothetical protein